MKSDEKELIRRSKQGDAAAFGEIVRRYQQPVYAVAFQIVREPAAAQDVAQESFISAFTALKDLRSDDAFPSWLRTIALHKALASRKEQDRLAPLEDAADIPSQPERSGIETETEAREGDAFRAEVRRIVASLSDALRFPLLLCYLDGVPTRQAARFLGIKEGTLRKRLHDGKKKLQARIVTMAEKTLQEYRLPRGFARKCICGCRRAQEARPREQSKIQKEVIQMAKTNQGNCGCGCVPTGTAKREEKKPKRPKKQVK
jgi:RNA polymerase sigma-70 factor (ECF subfamily)